MRKYTKKVIVKDERSTPEARSERLRRVRNLSNLTRKQICDDKTININTFTGWELAKFGGLPVDGAERIVKRVAKEGVICSIDWLLHGTGLPPQVIIDRSNESNLIENSFSIPSYLEVHEKAIFEELIIFRKYYKDIIYLIIQDDSMLPIYKPGEWVAGANYYGNAIPNLIGLDCIVKTEDGQTLVRTLRLGNIENCYDLICKNTNTTLRMPVLYNTKIVSAAPIIRHFSQEVYRLPFH